MVQEMEAIMQANKAKSSQLSIRNSAIKSNAPISSINIPSSLKKLKVKNEKEITNFLEANAWPHLKSFATVIYEGMLGRETSNGNKMPALERCCRVTPHFLECFSEKN